MTLIFFVALAAGLGFVTVTLSTPSLRSAAMSLSLVPSGTRNARVNCVVCDSFIREEKSNVINQSVSK